jgi:hypothetical protein
MTQASRTIRPARVAALACAIAIASAAPAAAQLDPLLPIKQLPPNVIVVVDTSFRMLDDGDGNYFDPLTYASAADPTVAGALGVPLGATSYRRIYQGLQFENVQDASTKYTADNIVAVSNTDPAYASFWAPTRLEIMKAGLAQAVGENPWMVRWGLMKLRQNGEAWRTAVNCDKPVRISGLPLKDFGDSSPCNAGPTGRYAVSAPITNGASFSIESPPGDSLLVPVPQTNVPTSNASLITLVQRAIQDSSGLIPAGRDASQYTDRPIAHALEDARAMAMSAIGGDTVATRPCRNTVVVLITSGRDSGDSTYNDTHDAVSIASTFASVAVSGVARRVPIVVIGLKPDAADVPELTSIATASGGRYFSAASAGDIAYAVNYAVQLGFAKSTDLQVPQLSEYNSTSPIVGTVNLIGASDVNGSLLPDTDIVSTSGETTGQPVPQRSNFMITAGYALPGFDGRLRAFRTFKPEADSTKPTGWRFVADGSRLWPDLDGRPLLAGMARAPSAPGSRNIYTFIPNGSGGGQVVRFDLTESATLAPHLGGADPATLIPFIRSQPLGAIVGSTPAIMDPPSLDPPPDEDYGYADAAGSFAATYKNRRAMIFFGANDGMVHAVDARTGFEVWAFIPYNLLPKLRTLVDGQSVEQFDYFVDSSPKVAEVKLGGNWRTLLIIGQSYGGTFYQAFDVTEAGMGVDQAADGLSAVTSMLGRFDAPGESIEFKWAFPNYSSFDPDINFTQLLSDGFPGGRIRLYGDLKASATDVEKRVGFTFSDPAVGALIEDRTITGVISGSGYFPGIEGALPNRGSVPAGRALFVLNAATGLPVGNASGSSCSGTGCLDLGDISNGRKNTLQADVTASGEAGSSVVVKAYAGDSDGRYWRFALDSTGAISSTMLHNAGQPIYSSSALLFVGTSERYLFFGTGSDLLSSTTPGGAGTFKLIGLKDSAGPGVQGTVTFSHSLTPVSSSSSSPMTNGERPTSAPTVAGDIVFFTTTTVSATADCEDALTKLYAFTYLGGAAYDANGNGKLDNNESPVVSTTTGRGTAPFIVDQHLFFATTSLSGAGVTVYGDPADFNNGVGQVGVRILSWREIR